MLDPKKVVQSNDIPTKLIKRKWKKRRIISNDKELARIFNEFFVNIVPNLGVNTNHSFLINTDNENDPFRKISEN